MWNNTGVSTAPLWHVTVQEIEISPALSRVNRENKSACSFLHKDRNCIQLSSWTSFPCMTPLIHDSKKRVKTEHKGKLLHSVAKSLVECQWFERAEKKLEWVSKAERWLMGNSNNLFCKTINTSYIDAVELKSYLTWSKIIQRKNLVLMQREKLLYFSGLCGNISTL